MEIVAFQSYSLTTCVKISKKKNENFICKWMINNVIMPKHVVGPLGVNPSRICFITIYGSQTSFLISI